MCLSRRDYRLVKEGTPAMSLSCKDNPMIKMMSRLEERVVPTEQNSVLHLFLPSGNPYGIKIKFSKLNDIALQVQIFSNTIVL